MGDECSLACVRRSPDHDPSTGSILPATRFLHRINQPTRPYLERDEMLSSGGLNLHRDQVDQWSQWTAVFDRMTLTLICTTFTLSTLNHG